MKKQDGEGKKRVDLSRFYPGEPGMDQEIEVEAAVYDLLLRLHREDHARAVRDWRYGIILLPPMLLDMQSEKDIDPAAVLVRSVDASRIRDAFRLLTKTQRRRVRAYVFEGLSYAQIARIEDVEEYAIRKSIRDSLCKMANFLR